MGIVAMALSAVNFLIWIAIARNAQEILKRAVSPNNRMWLLIISTIFVLAQLASAACIPAYTQMGTWNRARVAEMFLSATFTCILPSERIIAHSDYGWLFVWVVIGVIIIDFQF